MRRSRRTQDMLAVEGPTDIGYIPARSEEHPDRPRGRSRLRLRRLLGVAIILAISFTAFYVVFFTSIPDPLLNHIAPVKHFIAWVIADPSRAWIAAAALVVPHIGLYQFLFKDNE